MCLGGKTNEVGARLHRCKLPVFQGSILEGGTRESIPQCYKHSL